MSLSQTIAASISTIIACTILMIAVLMVMWKLAKRSARREYDARHRGETSHR